MTTISHDDLPRQRMVPIPVNLDERQTKFYNVLEEELHKGSVIVIQVPGPSSGLSNLRRCFDVDKKEFTCPRYKYYPETNAPYLVDLDEDYDEESDPSLQKGSIRILAFLRHGWRVARDIGADEGQRKFDGQCFFYNVDTDEEMAILPVHEWQDNIGPFPYLANTWTVGRAEVMTEEEIKKIRAALNEASLMPLPDEGDSDL